jgi:DNA modification methylase
MVLYESHPQDISPQSFSLDNLIETIRQMPFDKDSIPQENLDLANKFRTSLFPWRGQFSPELVEIFLSRYAADNAVILDPFLGSGTTLFESIRKGLKCYGAEINPSAIEMSRTAEFSNLSLEKRKNLIQEAIIFAEKFFKSPSYDLFSYQEEQNAHQDFDKTLGSSFKIMIQEAKNKPLLCSIITNAIIRFMSYKEPRTKSDFLNALEEHAKIIKMIPYNPEECKVFHSDARVIPLPNKSIDLVITSPPYINVFNYHQNNRVAMEFIGWDLLDIAKSEIGSNRKNRQNRFLTVIQYALYMLDTLYEIHRLLKPEGRAIIVVGRESNVRGISFNNSLLVMMLALGSTYFELEILQERKFVNKFGEAIYEDILHLIPNPAFQLPDDSFARSVALWHLHQNINRANKQIRSEIAEAIERVNIVQKSPIFSATTPESEKFLAKEVIMPKRKSNQKVVLEEIIPLARPFLTPHFDKLKAVLENNKLPLEDRPQVEKTIKHYEKWIANIETIMDSDLHADLRLRKMIEAVNEYRIHMDIDLIFDSQDDWLYRQKGQIKLDNSVIEEFLPRLIHVCLKPELTQLNVAIGPVNAFASVWFDSSLIKPELGGGLNIRSKNQDFAISRPLYLKTSNTPDFQQAVEKATNLAYAAAECKTNLDKTMFQEACATAGDLKSAIPGAKYFLLCEWLDMPPISTAITPIDKVFILRKAKRMNSSIRSQFDKVKGRQENKDFYLNFLQENPYKVEIFEMFIESIRELLQDEPLDEETVLDRGFF